MKYIRKYIKMLTGKKIYRVRKIPAISRITGVNAYSYLYYDKERKHSFPALTEIYIPIYKQWLRKQKVKKLI